jgi:hypothetical protein
VGDTQWETFDERAVEWAAFTPPDLAPAVGLVQRLLQGGITGSLVRIEGPEPPRPGGLLGRFKKAERLPVQVVAGRPGAPVVLTVGGETDEPVAARFAAAGVTVPERWTVPAPDGTFPWVEAPAGTDPEAVVAFAVDALRALGAPDGEWRVGIDTPRVIEHSHGPHGTHTHGPGEHRH